MNQYQFQRLKEFKTTKKNLDTYLSTNVVHISVMYCVYAAKTFHRGRPSMFHISEIMFRVFAAKTFHRGKPSVFHISEIIFCVYAAKTIHKGRPSK